MPGEGVGVLKFEESDGEDDGGAAGEQDFPSCVLIAAALTGCVSSPELVAPPPLIGAPPSHSRTD